jgi:hypothetical protein
MSDQPTTRPGSRLRGRVMLAGVLALGIPGLVVGGYFLFAFTQTNSSGPTPVVEASKAQVQQFCGSCHKYPPPDSFPKAGWREEVEQGYAFFEASSLPLHPPPKESVIKYYENRAPVELPLLRGQKAREPLPVRFQRTDHLIPGQPATPAVSNINLVHLFDDRKLDVLCCDMREGWVSAFRPYLKKPTHHILGRVLHPAHAEVVDLDGDGIKDVVVADLGSFYPTNDRVGSVVLLKGSPGGKFTPYTLLDGVGRVADVQCADFNGDGKIDLVVAVFGWRTTGEIIYLENQTTDWSKPKFVPHILDRRHGAIHVPVADLNGDGKPDFVALISQEHETIVAFLNDGKGRFRQKVIYSGPHPAYGSSGIQLVDLNRDGKIDILYTNGDSMDSKGLKPYHSVQWLENRGTFPFVHHHLTSLYGVHRAVAADIDGDGLLDIVAVSCLLEESYGRQRKELGFDSVILLHQTAPGQFVRHSLEKKTCDHVTCAVGDLYGDGKMHRGSCNSLSHKV